MKKNNGIRTSKKKATLGAQVLRSEKTPKKYKSLGGVALVNRKKKS